MNINLNKEGGKGEGLLTYKSEVDKYIKTLQLDVKCMAIKADGKKCTNKTINHSKVCKKHEKCKNLKLVQERKNFSCILYHNHLPNEIANNCPRCNLVK